MSDANSPLDAMQMAILRKAASSQYLIVQPSPITFSPLDLTRGAEYRRQSERRIVELKPYLDLCRADLLKWGDHTAEHERWQQCVFQITEAGLKCVRP